jgi:hypothetical protein
MRRDLSAARSLLLTNSMDLRPAQKPAIAPVVRKFPAYYGT